MYFKTIKSSYMSELTSNSFVIMILYKDGHLLLSTFSGVGIYYE